MHNVKESKGVKNSRIYTPKILSDRIYNLIKDNNFKTILDVCCGDFGLSYNFKNKIGIDIQEPNNKESLKMGKFYKDDFLNSDLEYLDKYDIDLIVCNPPFNGAPGRKLYPEVFLDKILEKYPNTPIIMITPIGLLYNQKINSKRWKKLKNLDITFTMINPVDVFLCESNEGIIHNETLFINFDKVKYPVNKKIYFIED